MGDKVTFIKSLADDMVDVMIPGMLSPEMKTLQSPLLLG